MILIPQFRAAKSADVNHGRQMMSLINSTDIVDAGSL